MKCYALMRDCSPLRVAPLAGAWIEIGIAVVETLVGIVAPLAGAWIEIRSQTITA